MIRIICPEPSSFSDSGLSFASKYATLFAREMEQAEFDFEAPNYDAALVRFNTHVGENVMLGSVLKAVLSPTTGLDHIDFEAARRHKVRVYHLRGQKKFLRQVSATAEFTVALMLAVFRNLSQAVKAVNQRRWQPGPLRGRELYGKTLGIVGCGRLGSKVARICRAFGMRVIIFDPFISRLPIGAERSASLQSLLGQSDIVSLHVPLLKETRHMISSREFGYFKTGAVLINTSRGAIIDSESLLIALQTKKLSAAALDVLDDEGLVIQQGRHLLLDYAKDHDNLLITPHIGGATFESVEKTDLFILERYFKDQGITA